MANIIEDTITEADLELLTSQIGNAFREADEDNGWRQIAGRIPGTYSGGHEPLLWNSSSIQSRDDGRYIPFYQHESDLRKIREKTQNLATFTSIAVGALSALRAYTVGGEWQYEAKVREGVLDSEVSRRLVDAVQKVVDTALERNEFQGVYDAAIHDAAREDGEALIGIYGYKNGNAKIRIINPDCLREPANPREIEYGLNRCGFDLVGKQSWTFGVHTAYDEVMRRVDHSTPVGYHVVYDDAGKDWDYLPAFPRSNAGRILSGKCLVHLKLNVPPNAKRGVSDYYPVQELLERKHILGRNLSIGGAIQAAIAYIRHHKGAVTRDQVVSRISAALDTYSRQATSNRTDGKAQQNFTPGTVIDTTTEYHAGPLGENRSPIFLEIAGYLMRCCAVRWNMPEYMISSDASNSNLASTLIAESPFVRARESDQRQLGATFKRICWAAVKIAHDAGRFSGLVASWQQLRQLIDIAIKPPVVASRDRKQTLEEASALYDKRIISANDVLTDLGREAKPEFDDKFADPPTPPAPTIVAGVPVGGNPSVAAAQKAAMAAALESVKTTDEARLILESLAGGGDPDGRWVTYRGRHIFIHDDGSGGGGGSGDEGGVDYQQTLGGEFWLMNGQAMFADGDIGDMNHEGYAINQAQAEVVEAMGQDQFNEGDFVDWDGFEGWLNEEYEDEDAQLAALKEAGVDDDVYAVASGFGDARALAADKWDWIRVAGNSVQMKDASQLKDLADGLADVHPDDDTLEKQSFDIETKTAFYTDVPWHVIDGGKAADLRQYKSHGTPGWGGNRESFHRPFWKRGRRNAA